MNTSRRHNTRNAAREGRTVRTAQLTSDQIAARLILLVIVTLVLAVGAACFTTTIELLTASAR